MILVSLVVRMADLDWRLELGREKVGPGTRLVPHAVVCYMIFWQEKLSETFGKFDWWAFLSFYYCSIITSSIRKIHGSLTLEVGNNICFESFRRKERQKVNEKNTFLLH